MQGRETKDIVTKDINDYLNKVKIRLDKMRLQGKLEKQLPFLRECYNSVVATGNEELSNELLRIYPKIKDIKDFEQIQTQLEKMDSDGIAFEQQIRLLMQRFIKVAESGDKYLMNEVLRICPIIKDHIDQKAGWYRNALMVAADNGHLDIVRTLVVNKANLNIQSEQRFSALMYAARNNHALVVNHLLCNKADVTIESDRGDTALGLAVYYGNEDVISVFKGHGYQIADTQKHWTKITGNRFFSCGADTDIRAADEFFNTDHENQEQTTKPLPMVEKFNKLKIVDRPIVSDDDYVILTNAKNSPSCSRSGPG